MTINVFVLKGDVTGKISVVRFFFCLVYLITLLLLHSAQRGEDAAKRGGRRPCSNSHGNYIVDHGKIMDLCF